MDLAAPGNVFGLDESLQPTLRNLTDRLDDPAIDVGIRDLRGKVTFKPKTTPSR